MRWFTKAHRPGRSGAVLRTRLSLESLDGRFAPTSLYGSTLSPPVIGMLSGGGTGDAGRVTPQITEFTAHEVEPGLYVFTGRVEGLTACGGLTVNFGGVPSLMGKFAVTDAEGCFMLQVVVRTDGSDDGMVVAQTVAGGVASNVAQVQIAPSA
jgi:hypothetical protein